jgi:hypothetical protein
LGVQKIPPEPGWIHVRVAIPATVTFRRCTHRIQQPRQADVEERLLITSLMTEYTWAAKDLNHTRNPLIIRLVAPDATMELIKRPTRRKPIPEIL